MEKVIGVVQCIKDDNLAEVKKGEIYQLFSDGSKWGYDQYIKPKSYPNGRFLNKNLSGSDLNSPYYALITVTKDENEIKEESAYGERKNSNKLRWRNVPLFILKPVIEVGALAEKRADNPKGKYETFNFLKGMAANDTLDSLKRHLEAFESPYELDVDSESGLSHLAHIAWNALVLLHSLKQYPELDDRYKIPQVKQLSPEEIQKRGR